MAQDILRTGLCRFCQHPHEVSFFTTATVQWKHILLDIIMIASVNIPVHMDRKTRDHDQISVDIYKLFQDFSVLVDDHAACHAEADALLRTIYELGGDRDADLLGKDGGLLLRS